MALLRVFSWIIFFACCASMPGYSQNAQKKNSLFTKKYSPKQLQEDARVFSNVLLAMHPAIGIYKPREYYTNLFNGFIASLTDSLTEKQFRIKTKLIIDELHCGHTEVLYSSAFYKEANKMKQNYSPYIFLPVHDKAYMIANLNKKQDSILKKGVEVTRINGVSVDSMLRYSKRFISTDGFNETGKNHYVQLGFNSYYLGLFGRPDTFEVEFKEGKGLKNLKYAAFKPKSLPPLPLGPKADSLFTRFRTAKMGYKFLDEKKSTMMLKIDRFSHRGDMIAYRKIFRKLRKNKTENLIIDLRNNGGGSLANSYRLLSYLVDTTSTQTLRTLVRNYPFRKYTSGNIGFKFTRLAYMIIGKKKTVNDTDYFVYTIKPRKRNHYNNKVYVLINGGSFSASCLVAAYLKNKNRATFIGEETGGTIEGCNAGITPFYKLPNTKIRIRVPAFRIVHDVNAQITGHGIIPDYKVEYSLKDILSKRDLEMKKARELINLAQ
jgi:hypothetical protein